MHRGREMWDALPNFDKDYRDDEDEDQDFDRTIIYKKTKINCNMNFATFSCKSNSETL